MAFVSLMMACQPTSNREAYSWEEDLHHRLSLDFCRTEAEVKAYIEQYIPDVSEAQLRQWEEQGALECMLIDGEKRYFRNAAPNLFRIDSVCRALKIAKEGSALSGSEQVNQQHLPEVIRAVRAQQTPFVETKRFRITYTLTVEADAVPAGERVRCWLPYWQPVRNTISIRLRAVCIARSTWRNLL